MPGLMQKGLCSQPSKLPTQHVQGEMCGAASRRAGHGIPSHSITWRPPLQILSFVKIFHWLVQDRVDFVETTPNVSRLQHLRIVAFMGFLLVSG